MVDKRPTSREMRTGRVAESGYALPSQSKRHYPHNEKILCVDGLQSLAQTSPCPKASGSGTPLKQDIPKQTARCQPVLTPTALQLLPVAACQCHISNRHNPHRILQPGVEGHTVIKLRRQPQVLPQPLAYYHYSGNLLAGRPKLQQPPPQTHVVPGESITMAALEASQGTLKAVARDSADGQVWG